MQTIKLNNGVEMPVLGYGVFHVPPEEAERCVSDALKAGYRMIDTAQAYGNEEGVGAAIAKSGIPREEIFIVTKIWITNAGEEKAAKSIEASLRRLQTGYIDLLLIHQAYGDVFGSWRAMEKAYKAGKVRAIGVSNFQACRFYDFASSVDIKPAVNQLQCCVLSQQRGIEEEMARYDTKMMAWGPLGQGNDDLLNNPVLTAIGAKYCKTAAQVSLRWLIQRGIVAIPKSTHPERMAANIDIFDFELSEADMHAIEPLNQQDTGFRDFGDPNYLRRIIAMFPNV
ncbi:MAG: aldo/keto reductase [Paludibacteraceae bacterium]|nr:aldo/keto reductase [Paludibacteraceae bacterium]